MTGGGRCGKNGRVDQVGAPRRSGIWGCHVTSAAVNQQSGAGTRRLSDGATAWPAGARPAGTRPAGTRPAGTWLAGQATGIGRLRGRSRAAAARERLGPRRRVRQRARRRRDSQLRHAPARCGTSRTARARPRDDRGQSAPDSACSAAPSPGANTGAAAFAAHRFSALPASGPRLTRIRHQVRPRVCRRRSSRPRRRSSRPPCRQQHPPRHRRPRYRPPQHRRRRHPLRRTRPHRHRGSVRCLWPRIGYGPQPRGEAEAAVRDAGWRTAGRPLAQRGRRHRRGRRAPARAAPPPAVHRRER